MIQSANVIISFFLKPLLDLDQGIISLRELERDSESIFVFDNTPNSNLIRFTHSLGGGGGNSSDITQLEIIDPDSRLEKAFATTRFTSVLPQNFRDTEFTSSDGKPDTEEAEKYLGSIRERFPAFNKGNLNLGKIGVTPSIWITYGVGSDFSNWCAPYKTTFVESSLDYSRGSRILTINFATGTYLLDLEINDLFGAKSTTKPTETIQTIVAKSSSPRLDVGIGDSTTQFKLPEHLSSFTEPGNSLDFKVEDVFIDYISKSFDVSPSQVIYLMPKISVLFASELSNLSKKYTEKYKFDSRFTSSIVNFYAEKELCKILGFDVEEVYFYPEGVPTLSTANAITGNHRVYPDKVLLDYRIKIISNNQKFRDSLNNILARISNNPIYAPSVVTHFQTNSYMISLFSRMELIAEDLDTALVFGDAKFIRRYLYGGINFDLTPEEKSKHTDLFYEEKKILLTEKYNREVINDRRDKSPIFDTPSTFFKPVQQSNAEAIRKLRVPVFRYNVEDPNVLSIDLDEAKTSTAVLSQLPSLAHQWVSTLGTDEILEKFDLPISNENRESLIEYLKKYQDIAINGRNLTSDIGEMEQQLAPVDLETMADFIIETQKNLSLNNPKTVKLLDALTGDNIFAHSLRAMERYYSQAIEGSITTLPHFWLSNPYILGDVCVLFSLEPRSFRTLGNAPIRAAYSGSYIIMGFTHTIDRSNVNSEFLIVKNSNLLESLDITEDETEEDEIAEISLFVDEPEGKSILDFFLPRGIVDKVREVSIDN